MPCAAKHTVSDGMNVDLVYQYIHLICHHGGFCVL